MCGRHRFVTSRHQQSQPLGIVAGSLYLYGAAFHGADLCAFDAAANRIIKIGQAEITFIIGTRKPFRRYAANTLATRYVHAESVGNRLLGLGQAHYVHGSFSYWAWVEAQRCAATLPVGETGGARARAAGCGGGSPARRGAQNARLHAPGADVVVQNSSTARKTGDTAPAGTDRPVLHPCPREGGALSDYHMNKRTEGLLSLFSLRRRGHERGKNPASQEAGCFDPVGSFVVATGPDQVEAVVAFAFHQRGVDRRRKTGIVEFDREIFAIAVPRRLLPRGAAFDGTCDDPIVGRLVVILFGRDELCPEVERERLDRSAVAVVRRGEGADGSHGTLRLFSGRADRSLDGGPWPGKRSARRHQAQSIAEDGGRRLFCPARNAATSRQGKKAGLAVAGRRSRRSRPSGPDPSIRGCVGRARKRTDGDHHDCRHLRRSRTWHRRSHQDLRPRINAEEGVTWRMTVHDCGSWRARWGGARRPRGSMGPASVSGMTARQRRSTRW